jgi:hypothetical protein
MIFIPRSVYIAVALVLALFGIYRWGFHNGWYERDADMQAEIAIKNEESRQKELLAAEKLNTTATKLQEANDVIDEKQSALERSIRAGRVRLPTSSCVQATASTPAPTGNSQEAGSESDRQTLLLIAEIAADGDKAINQLNACITAYEQVRESINASNR